MIGMLKGRVESVDTSNAVVDVQGLDSNCVCLPTISTPCIWVRTSKYTHP